MCFCLSACAPLPSGTRAFISPFPLQSFLSSSLYCLLSRRFARHVSGALPFSLCLCVCVSLSFSRSLVFPLCPLLFFLFSVFAFSHPVCECRCPSHAVVTSLTCTPTVSHFLCLLFELLFFLPAVLPLTCATETRVAVCCARCGDFCWRFVALLCPFSGEAHFFSAPSSPHMLVCALVRHGGGGVRRRSCSHLKRDARDASSDPLKGKGQKKLGQLCTR